MARTPAKSATRTTEAAATTRKRRLSRVEARPGQSLTSAEENVMRMHHGLDTGLHTPLPSNAINAAIRAQLLEIELRAYQATGRWQESAMLADDAEDEAPAAKAPSAAGKKDRIVSQLKTRR